MKNAETQSARPWARLARIVGVVVLALVLGLVVSEATLFLWDVVEDALRDKPPAPPEAPLP